MYSGPPPWLGTQVKVIAGHYKSYWGIVRDVNCWEASASGLHLTLEILAWTSQGVNPQVRVDYDHVREPQFVNPPNYI
jgi:hypothetical protein